MHFPSCDAVRPAAEAALDGRRLHVFLEAERQLDDAACEALRKEPRALLTPHLGYVTRETYKLFFDGTVEAIDTGLKLGANHPMGPLELADFIGLDTCLSVMQVLHEGLADTKYRPCPLLVKYVEAGWLGRKTNRGFYDYRGEKPVPTR